MSLKTTKNEPIQYQIAEYIMNSLRDSNRLADASTIDMCYAVFQNFRLSNSVPKGLRLTTFGNRYMSKHFTSFEYPLAEELVGITLVNLDRAMTRPYYLTKKKVTFYDENDAAWFRLGGSNLQGFSKSL